MSLKIGLLLPSSEYYPTLAGDFMNGIRFAFEGKVELLFEGIGNGTDEKVIRAAEKFILQDNVDAVIGFSGYNRLEALVALFDAYQKPFVHVDIGANIYSHKPSPYVLHQSLNLWESCYYLGRYVSCHGEKIAITASFYEAGYQLYYAFCEGVKNPQSGVELVDSVKKSEIIANHIAGADYKNYDFGAMYEAVIAQNPDFVLNLFSYKEGNIVLEQLQQSPIKNINTAINPVMLDAFKNINSTATFVTVSAYNFESEAMKYFTENYKTQYRKAPNEIVLLAYESALNIIKSLEKSDLAIAESLKDTVIESPRGRYGFDDLNRNIVEDFYLIKIKNKALLHQKIKSQPAAINHLIQNTTPNGGWFNPYLCT